MNIIISIYDSVSLIFTTGIVGDVREEGEWRHLFH